jgi:hypothetical protein
MSEAESDSLFEKKTLITCSETLDLYDTNEALIIKPHTIFSLTEPLCISYCLLLLNDISVSYLSEVFPVFRS